MDKDLKRQQDILKGFFSKPHKKDHVLAIQVGEHQESSGGKHEIEVDSEAVRAKALAESGYYYCFKSMDDIEFVGTMINDFNKQLRKYAEKEQKRKAAIIEGEA